MKTLGIIGGIGPESTIEYYRQVVAVYRERRADGTSPSIVINSIGSPASSNTTPSFTARTMGPTWLDTLGFGSSTTGLREVEMCREAFAHIVPLVETGRGQRLSR